MNADKRTDDHINGNHWLHKPPTDRRPNPTQEPEHQTTDDNDSHDETPDETSSPTIDQALPDRTTTTAHRPSQDSDNDPDKIPATDTLTNNVAAPATHAPTTPPDQITTTNHQPNPHQEPELRTTDDNNHHHHDKNPDETPTTAKPTIDLALPDRITTTAHRTNRHRKPEHRTSEHSDHYDEDPNEIPMTNTLAALPNRLTATNHRPNPHREPEHWTNEDSDRNEDLNEVPMTDTLAIDLAALATDAPAALLDRITATWIRVPSVIGDLYVASTDLGIAYVRTSDAVHDDDQEFAALFHQRFTRPLMAARRPPAGLLPALHQHRANKLKFDLTRLSHFEREVLLAVMSIPRGQVRPYAWVAHRIGRPKAVRAVGSALGHNPVPVLIPCHRVIRSDGTVGDYVFGPVTKRELLNAEGTNIGEVYELARNDIHYVGSDTTGIVCFPTCPNARRITTPHRHGFHSITEAETAGYRPCQHCQPATHEVA